MTPTKVIEVLRTFQKKLPAPRQLNDHQYDLRGDSVPKVYEKAHLAWMCERAIEFVNAGRMEKAMRWLGWLNYGMYEHGFFTLNEVKKISAPAPDEPKYPYKLSVVIIDGDSDELLVEFADDCLVLPLEGYIEAFEGVVRNWELAHSCTVDSDGSEDESGFTILDVIPEGFHDAVQLAGGLFAQLLMAAKLVEKERRIASKALEEAGPEVAAVGVNLDGVTKLSLNTDVGVSSPTRLTPTQVNEAFSKPEHFTYPTPRPVDRNALAQPTQAEGDKAPSEPPDTDVQYDKPTPPPNFGSNVVPMGAEDDSNCGLPTGLLAGGLEVGNARREQFFNAELGEPFDPSIPKNVLVLEAVINRMAKPGRFSEAFITKIAEEGAEYLRRRLEENVNIPVEHYTDPGSLTDAQRYSLQAQAAQSMTPLLIVTQLQGFLDGPEWFPIMIECEEFKTREEVQAYVDVLRRQHNIKTVFTTGDATPVDHMWMKNKYEFDHTLVLSTGHVPRETMELIESSVWSLNDEYATVFRINWESDDNPLAELEDEHLQRIISFGLGLNATHIKLDRDGPVIEDLPTFDW